MDRTTILVEARDAEGVKGTKWSSGAAYVRHLWRCRAYRMRATMATNLVDLVMSYITPDVVSKAASFVGESGPATQKAVAGIIPTQIAALANLASTSGGLEQIGRMLDSGTSAGVLTNLGSLFGGGAQTQDAVRTGQGMIESLFGGKLGSVTDLIARSAGLRAASVTSLMALIGPLILAVLGRQRAAAGGSLAGLASLLGDQKSFLSGLLPAGLASMLGWPAPASGVSQVASGAAAGAAAVASRRPAWLIPLAAIAGLILIALGYLWSAPPVGQIARQAQRKLAELQLPGGPKISVARERSTTASQPGSLEQRTRPSPNDSCSMTSTSKPAPRS
jgi:hypothetical protein